jgi:ectoine hydroxylase-related dioxygenase (phytanoyl-CoA dioxygenase family)
MELELQQAVAADLDAIRERGYVVIERLLSEAQLAAVRDRLAPYLSAELYGRTRFEGLRTERVYTLVTCAPIFAELVEHPRILAICDALLAPNYLLTTAQAIRIHPGERPQPLHFDDTFHALPSSGLEHHFRVGMAFQPKASVTDN